MPVKIWHICLLNDLQSKLIPFPLALMRSFLTFWILNHNVVFKGQGL